MKQPCSHILQQVYCQLNTLNLPPFPQTIIINTHNSTDNHCLHNSFKCYALILYFFLQTEFPCTRLQKLMLNCTIYMTTYLVYFESLLHATSYSLTLSLPPACMHTLSQNNESSSTIW